MVKRIKKNTSHLKGSKGENIEQEFTNKQDLPSKSVKIKIDKSNKQDKPLVNKTKVQNKILKTKQHTKDLPTNTSPNSVALISRFYQSELDLGSAKLPNRNVKILKLLAKT